MPVWNPWHGCRKISAGCLNCYMYRRDAQFGKDSTVVSRTADFDLAVRRKRDGSYKIESGAVVYVCMTSDFFIDEADKWRAEIWRMIKERPDVNFYIITKRINRFNVCLPDDWNSGYDNVTVCCTCENQRETDNRLPVFLSLPVKHREIIHEPMLENIDIEKYLSTGGIDRVICGGESGPDARLCSYDWILNTREQCIRNNVSFVFKQTGAKFEKDGRVFSIERKYQHSQAVKADLNVE